MIVWVKKTYYLETHYKKNNIVIKQKKQHTLKSKIGLNT